MKSSSMKPSRLRVGIPIIGGKGWLGGVSYVELLARSNAERSEASRLSLTLIVKPENLESLDLHLPFVHAFDAVLFWLPPGIALPAGLNAGGKACICHSAAEVLQHIDVYFPLPWDAWPDVCAASWLPDFQHRFLPDFFSAQERESRDRDIGKVAQHAPFIVLSSKTAERHFRQFYPESKTLTEVLSFYTLVEEKTFTADIVAVKAKYKLPDRYLMCSNQFWIHKDHATLFRAMAKCRDQGLAITLVCTGAMEDYRHPHHMANLRRLLGELRLDSQVHLLGTLPRQEQLQLMRGAMATVQPSLFEGWSTVVEDGRALGKIQFLSDLDVHREQAPRDALFFKQGDVEDLSDALMRSLPHLRPGPDLARENLARREGKDQVRTFGEKFEAVMWACYHHHKLESRLNEARQFFRLGQASEAESLLEALTQEPQLPARCFNDLGVIRLSLNKRREALQAFGQALLIDMQNTRAFENLWDTLAASLEWDSAVQTAESGMP